MTRDSDATNGGASIFCAMAGMICGVPTLVWAPVALGTLGVVFGIASHRTGEIFLGTITVVTSVVLSVVSIFLGVLGT